MEETKLQYLKIIEKSKKVFDDKNSLDPPINLLLENQLNNPDPWLLNIPGLCAWLGKKVDIYINKNIKYLKYFY